MSWIPVSDLPRLLKLQGLCFTPSTYSIPFPENWGGVDRYFFNAISSDQDLADSFFPMFEASVRLGQASSLMCSYNGMYLPLPSLRWINFLGASEPLPINSFLFLCPPLIAEVNGVPSCANHDAMTVLAREAWGFQGYITSDCSAVLDVYATHRYYKSPSGTCNGVLSAGMDLECGEFLAAFLLGAIKKGAVSNATVNNALFNQLMVQMRLGWFDPLDQQVQFHQLIHV